MVDSNTYSIHGIGIENLHQWLIFCMVLLFATGEENLNMDA